ncbi:MAG: hypothetical protein ACMG55_07575 [Microcoleus sp.]
MSDEELMANLKMLEADPNYITESAYSPNGDLWEDNRVPFIDRHMMHLKSHKTVIPEQYLSNLRLMLKKR